MKFQVHEFAATSAATEMPGVKKKARTQKRFPGLLGAYCFFNDARDLEILTITCPYSAIFVKSCYCSSS